MMNDEEAIQRLAGTLRLLRAEKKISLRVLAEKIKIEHSTLYRLENATTPNPSLFLIRKVAEYYNMTVDELMNFSAKPCPTCGGSGWIREKGK